MQNPLQPTMSSGMLTWGWCPKHLMNIINYDSWRLFRVSYQTHHLPDKSSHSHLRRARRYPDVEELMHSLTASDSCTMCNVTKLLRNVTGRYGSVMELLQSVRPIWNVIERYGNVADHYVTLQNVTQRYRALQDVMERYGSVVEALRGVAERYGTLRSVVGRYGTLWKRCRSVRNVTGALRCPYGTLRNR